MIFYLIKYVPNYENTILVLKDDIKIEREEPLEKSEENLFLLKKNIYVKEISNLNGIWVGKTYFYDELKEMSLFFRWLINSYYYFSNNLNGRAKYTSLEENRINIIWQELESKDDTEIMNALKTFTERHGQ